jgi:DHA1 family tetracycline resistance protein-like MFS transporter
VILVTVALDAMGVGLVLPILPGLLRELGHESQVAGHYGLLLAAYALAQFVCSPILGMLSDRFGRRPVLLVSLAGAAVDYLIMAVAPVLWLFYASRVVAGITGASMAVASAYITDITPQAERGQKFGWMNACFGLGFVAGPLLGGVLGEHSLRYPFVAAAVLCGLNFLLGLFVLPESLARRSAALTFKGLNPLASLRGVFRCGAWPCSWPSSSWSSSSARSAASCG